MIRFQKKGHSDTSAIEEVNRLMKEALTLNITGFEEVCNQDVASKARQYFRIVQSIRLPKALPT